MQKLCAKPAPAAPEVAAEEVAADFILAGWARPEQVKEWRDILRAKFRLLDKVRTALAEGNPEMALGLIRDADDAESDAIWARIERLSPEQVRAELDAAGRHSTGASEVGSVQRLPQELSELAASRARLSSARAHHHNPLVRRLPRRVPRNRIGERPPCWRLDSAGRLTP